MLTVYPNGFSGGVNIRGVNILNNYTGSVFYVDSNTGSDGNSGQTPERPCATIDYVISYKCTANKGDMILVMPGHAETVSSATGLVMDVAGVQVIGMGQGSLMPKITLDTAAAATISITAANCTFANMHLHSDYTGGLTAGITLGASADGCILDGIYFTEAANTKEYLLGISITADCDDVTIRNCRYIGIDGGSTTSFVSAAGGTDRLVFKDNFFRGDASAAAIKLDNAASSDILIENNRIINIDTGAGLGIATHNSSTGMMAHNLVLNLKDTVAPVSGTGMGYFENYGSNAANASGIIWPAVDS